MHSAAEDYQPERPRKQESAAADDVAKDLRFKDSQPQEEE